MAASGAERAGDLPELGFRLADPGRRLTGVRLINEVGLASDAQFSWARGVWSLRVPPPDVDRFEYLFEITEHGHQRTILDPGNPRRVNGAFGDKSVAWLPGYAEPRWLHSPGITASSTEFQIGDVDGRLWTPDSLEHPQAAPLLVVHDGPEYDELASFTQYVGAHVGAGTLPPLRVALLAPGDRNARYSADGAYARTLCDEIVPALRQEAPFVVGVGASLGALAMLHAHCEGPGTFDGLLLQSGSFFTPDLDPQERQFSGFASITSFVADIEQCAHRPVPTVLTCGTVEENLANNRHMADVLSGLGYPARLVVVRDAHNYTAWRDALDPHLTELLQEVRRHAP